MVSDGIIVSWNCGRRNVGKDTGEIAKDVEFTQKSLTAFQFLKTGDVRASVGSNPTLSST